MRPSSSQASCSPVPNFERFSSTHGMPYALTRFAAARMSCGACLALLSPSLYPVGGGVFQPSLNIISSTSTPVSSGPSASRYHGYQKTPYLQATPLVSQQASLQGPQRRGGGEVEAPSPTTPSLVPSQVTSATASDSSLSS